MSYDEWKNSISEFNTEFAERLTSEILATQAVKKTSSTSHTQSSQTSNIARNLSTGTPTTATRQPPMSQPERNDTSRASSKAGADYFSSYHPSAAPTPSLCISHATAPSQMQQYHRTQSQSGYIDPALITGGSSIGPSIYPVLSPASLANSALRQNRPPTHSEQQEQLHHLNTASRAQSICLPSPTNVNITHDYGSKSSTLFQKPPTLISRQPSLSRALEEPSNRTLLSLASQPQPQSNASSLPYRNLLPSQSHTLPAFPVYHLQPDAATPDIITKLNSLTDHISHLSTTLSTVIQHNLRLQTRLINSEIYTDRYHRALNLQVTRYPPSPSIALESIQRIAFSILGVLGFNLFPIPVHNNKYWGITQPDMLHHFAGPKGWDVVDCTGSNRWLFSIDSAYPHFSNTEGTILISCVSKSLFAEVMRRYEVWEKLVLGAANEIPWRVERDDLIGKFEVREGGGL